MGILYSDIKMFHFQEKLDSLPEDKAILPPLHIRIKPTNQCNHRCRYCAYLAENLQLGQDMRQSDSIPREKMLEIAHDLVAMNVKAVTFSGGGEPLIYPHLLEASRIMHDGGVKLATLTNGARLNGELAEFFAHNATWVRISMDGWDDASYSRYRGVKDGEYTKIMRNLENFAALNGKCILGVCYIIDAENHAHVPEMLRRLKDAGVHSVKVSACIVSNDASENTAYHTPHMTSTKESLATVKQELEDEGFEIFDALHDLDDRFAKSYTWCPSLQVKTVIAADCRVYTCQDKAYTKKGILGDISQQSFKEFWMAGKKAFMGVNPMLDCTHHCVANTKNQALLEYLAVDLEHVDFV